MQRPESAHRSTSRVSFNDDSESDDEDSHTKSSRSGKQSYRTIQWFCAVWSVIKQVVEVHVISSTCREDQNELQPISLILRHII